MAGTEYNCFYEKRTKKGKIGRVVPNSGFKNKFPSKKKLISYTRMRAVKLVFNP